MAIGRPSAKALLEIYQRSEKRLKARTLRVLRDGGLTFPKPGRDTSRMASDWEVTDEGLRAARDLRIFGAAHWPGSFPAERRKFEDSLNALSVSQPGASAAPKAPAELTVATWNLRSSSDADSTLAHLDSADWDIACLQEVGIVASNRLEERDTWSVVNGLKLAYDGVRAWDRPHGAALVARNGWRFDHATVVETPTPGRGVIAPARSGDEGITIASWHAPHAVAKRGETKSEVVARKMRGYESLVDALDGIEGPLVLGMDANVWNLRTDLEPPAPPDQDEPQYLAELFFSSEPNHRLRDSLLVYLADNPAAHQKLLAARPEGPLYVTHKRGGHGQPDRFDYIMISEDFRVAGVANDHEGACAAGSDHAYVEARLIAA